MSGANDTVENLFSFVQNQVCVWSHSMSDYLAIHMAGFSYLPLKSWPEKEEGQVELVSYEV